MAKFGKWIGGGLGWAFGGPIGAVIGFTVGSMFDGGKGQAQTDRSTGYSGRTTTGGYVMSLLVLVAAVMKADGKVLKSELDYVKKFMVHNFGEASAAEAIKMLKDSIEKRGINVVRHFSDIPHVRIQKAKLIQIFINLIKN